MTMKIHLSDKRCSVNEFVCPILAFCACSHLLYGCPKAQHGINEKLLNFLDNFVLDKTLQ